MSKAGNLSNSSEAPLPKSWLKKKTKCSLYWELSPLSQTDVLLSYLQESIDTMMTASRCENVLIVRDLNPSSVKLTFNVLLITHDLHKYVTFQTHASRSSLDPMVTDLPPQSIQRFPLDCVGTADQVALLTKIKFKKSRELCLTRTLWKLDSFNWRKLRADLKGTDYGEGVVLTGDVKEQTIRHSECLLTLQVRWVPHSTQTAKASDQPWFDVQSCVASDAKHRTWIVYKRHPTARRRQRQWEATECMRRNRGWAI